MTVTFMYNFWSLPNKFPTIFRLGNFSYKNENVKFSDQKEEREESEKFLLS